MTYCGIDCKSVCDNYGKGCLGCEQTCGKPFGGTCVSAEHVKKHGTESLSKLHEQIICEINALGIDGLVAEKLYDLNGSYVNLEYTLDNGTKAKFLDDNKVYLGCQVERQNNQRCYGVVASEEFILVCEYGCNGDNPVLVAYKKR